ncbi:MAG: metallophosphoesterase family protein [Tissierellia bacterium]|nr:metallophosphoesterase family protein [Tissierellia bacterium]
MKIIKKLPLALALILIPHISLAAKNPLIENEKMHRTDLISKNDKLSEDKNESDDIKKPEVREVPVDNEPNRIVTTILKDPSTQMGFSWYTTDKFDDSEVRISENSDMSNFKSYKADRQEKKSHYVQRDKNGYFIFQKQDKNNKVIDYFTDENKDKKWEHEDELDDSKEESVKIDVVEKIENRYSIKVTDLKPDTTYYYQVGSPSNSFSDIATFKTAGDDVTSFIQYTDTQNAFWNENKNNEARYASDVLRHAIDMTDDLDFILHTGDIVEISEVEDEWKDQLDQSRDSLLKAPLSPVAGNHDEYGLDHDELFPEKFTDHFTLDYESPVDGGVYYSYDYNNVHFINLNTNDYKNEDKKSLSDEQLKWLRDDVKKARDNGSEWVILNYHKPLFSKSYHSLEDEDVQNVRDDFMKAIDDLDIDLALQGHDHVFSRTKSLNYANKDQSFVNAQIDYSDYKIDSYGYKTLKSPKGTTFVLPNTAGTKAYDNIFDKSLDHIKKVRKNLDWLTQEQLDHYKTLFEKGEQPHRAEEFKDSHSNKRDSTFQNFAQYKIIGNKLQAKIYQVSGDLDNGDERKVELVDCFSIEK